MEKQQAQRERPSEIKGPNPDTKKQGFDAEELSLEELSGPDSLDEDLTETETDEDEAEGVGDGKIGRQE
jgi:hypothetical protein